MPGGYLHLVHVVEGVTGGGVLSCFNSNTAIRYP
jgi:hypothetical protein